MVKLNTSKYIPHAYISVNKGSTNNRLKIYEGRKIFLEKDCEFQIEFENYTNEVYLAKIKLNGNFISDTGLILKPGQHIYLDRYFEINKKFKFDVYEIEDTEEARYATQNNGWIEIYFYKEKKVPQTIVWKQYYTDNTGFYTNNNTYFSNCSGQYDASMKVNSFRLSKSINTKETGRIEQGSQSDQILKYEDREFEDIYIYSVSYNLLPLSQQVNSNVREYCTNCGYRLRDNKWTFCPKCGNKI